MSDVRTLLLSFVNAAELRIGKPDVTPELVAGLLVREHGVLKAAQFSKRVDDLVQAALAEHTAPGMLFNVDRGDPVPESPKSTPVKKRARLRLVK
jgi:hypothetical protein